MRSKGNEIRVSKDVFGSITSETVRSLFKFDDENDCYKAEELTWSTVEDAESTKQYAMKAAVGFHTVTRQIDFTPRDRGNSDPKPNVVPVKNTRNWGF
jgi:hypothetical protein